MVLERFESFVYPVPESGCHLWLGALDGGGYGVFWMDGRQAKAHRVAFELYRGPIPPGEWALHKCDVRSCVNAGHLFLGTNATNMQDRAAKGKQSGPYGSSRLLRGLPFVDFANGDRAPNAERVAARRAKELDTKGSRAS